ncbi:hypothetical protein OYT88_02270 [Sporolactobacillus sp. CQH2019]|uniref:hypothetical protein n=1 Tax=Sporolactobacillus sp. CQH2019 TaxID=3023512 RepID=UPI002368B2D0|nr:hypothetical protein [Sporolactobacillus sp. CQH2019]MDD9147375.1 hypothetical protein [Sporolactobacillus sp. CQH2019]
MFEVRKCDILFNDIYDALVVNNHKNDEYVIDLRKNGKKTIKKLKVILREENIEYRENGSKLICFLDEHSKRTAQNVYTAEVRKQLVEEQRELDKEFMRDFIYVVK